MAKEDHFASKVMDQLGGWQRKLRMLTSLVPGRKLPLLTPAEAFGPDVERFHDTTQALVPWRDKQSQSWFFAGHLKTKKGRPYGFQVSFTERHTQNDFLGAIPTRWIAPRIFSAYFTITDPMNGDLKKTFRYWQRGGLFSQTSGFAADDRLHIGIEGWHAYRRDDGIIILDVNAEGDSLHLELQALKPLAYHGQSGYSQKDAKTGTASFHCSYSRMQATGWLLIEGRLEDIDGQVWMDHEKITPQKNSDDAASDRISLQFNSGEELMLNFVRDHAWGSWINAHGEVKHLIRTDIKNENIENWISPRTGARYPIKRKIQIEPLGIELNIKTPVPAQEVDLTRTAFSCSWDGMISAGGNQKSVPLEGQGFMQLAGYDRSTRARLVDFFIQK